MNSSFKTTLLPYFRVAGLSVRSNPANQAHDLVQLWERFHLSRSLRDELPAFSTTNYCVYHNYAEDGSFTVVLGKLVATDIELPEHLSDVWIAPQNYAVFSLPEKHFHAALSLWQSVRDMLELSHRQRVDFETYPNFGEAKLYIGLVGKVEMEETFLDERIE